MIREEKKFCVRYYTVKYYNSTKVFISYIAYKYIFTMYNNANKNSVFHFFFYQQKPLNSSIYSY